MQAVFIVLLTTFTIMEAFSQPSTTDRQPVAAGRFYPADKEELTKNLSRLFESCNKTKENWQVRAIICPHAGYIFSGKIAASAFSSIPKNKVYHNIFIIGSSHVMYYNGASVYNEGDYITPLGKAVVNREIANALILKNKVFGFPVTAHMQEHSIEVQVPFIQYYFRNTPPIVPIIIGTDDENTVSKVAEALKPYFTPDNLFIISSDFSHYPSYSNAVATDKLTAMSILSGNPKTFLTRLSDNSAENIPGLVTSMCGWTSGLTLLYLTEGNKKLEYKLIDYCNSGDSPEGGKAEVVGYNAIALIEKNHSSNHNSAQDNSFSFSNEERKYLFALAKGTIQSRFAGNKNFETDEKSIPEKLMKPMGAFVTLKIDGNLRGCIGNFNMTDDPQPLYKVVAESAISSAFEDPRFNPLTKEEFRNTSMEITVLGPLKRINSINEIVLGKHGIYIKKGQRAGTMLPQVATENGWTVEEFLGFTSRDKAGIGWDGWKDAELYIYDGVVLEDNQK
jgi:MEMO1 family protein